MYEVWYVQGADPEAFIPDLFAYKIDAERYARMCFPTEEERTRYTRIKSRPVHQSTYQD
jgi:hypothetical protein